MKSMRIARCVAAALVVAGACKFGPRTDGNHATASDAATVLRATPDAEKPRAAAFSFTLDGRAVTAHRVTLEHAGARAYFLAACDIDGERHIVDLSPPRLDPGTYGGVGDSLVVFKVINTKTKGTFETSAASGAPFSVTIDAVAERLVGRFAGTVANKEGKKRVIADGRFDLARAQRGSGVRATAEFSLDGTRVRGLAGTFEPSGNRQRFQAITAVRPGAETVTLIIQTPSLEPGVYSFPGSDLDVRIIHIVASGAKSKGETAVYWLDPRAGVGVAGGEESAKGRFRFAIEKATNGRRATFDGVLLSHGGQKKAVISDGVMNLTTF